jgi:hypothetical protein
MSGQPACLSRISPWHKRMCVPQRGRRPVFSHGSERENTGLETTPLHIDTLTAFEGCRPVLVLRTLHKHSEDCRLAARATFEDCTSDRRNTEMIRHDRESRHDRTRRSDESGILSFRSQPGIECWTSGQYLPRGEKQRGPWKRAREHGARGIRLGGPTDCVALRR